MCGRFTLTVTVKDLQEILPALEAAEAILPRYNIAPTQLVPVVANDAPTRLAAFRWGLVPRWAKDASIGSKLINARAETLAEKPSFRDAFRKRRCLVFASGFYEWKKAAGSARKQPYLVTARGGRPLAFAGLWEEWRSPDGPLRTFTIITTSPNEQMRDLHDRMPAILAPSSFDAWLRPGPAEPAALAPLLAPTSEPLALTPVSTRVNSPAYDGPECIEAVTAS